MAATTDIGSPDTSAELDEILKEQSDLQRRLGELADDAFAERLEIKERRRELHDRAVSLSTDSR